jgi:uncharacterized protein (UPF0371 family)
MRSQLKDQAEIIVVINAEDIEKNKTRGDLGITYDQDVLRLIDIFRGFGFMVGSVVITRYREQCPAEMFKERLESLGLKVYRHYTIPGYPSELSTIVSDDGSQERLHRDQQISHRRHRPAPQRQDGNMLSSFTTTTSGAFPPATKI